MGYGSIGQRHARILADISRTEVAVVSRRDISIPYRSFPDMVSGLADWAPDYVVIASGTHEHSADIGCLAEADYRGKVLIEKPLFRTNAEMEIKIPNSAGAFIGYNLRFHPLIAKCRQLLDNVTPFAAVIQVGHDLRQWRPNTDYRVGYSADRNRGGGVLRDLSHELDLAVWLFDGWNSVMAQGGKFSDLEIDSDDVFTLLVATPRCPSVVIHLNYLDSRLQRGFRLHTDKGTLIADLTDGVLVFGDDQWSFPVARDDTYIAEHDAVLSETNDPRLCPWDQGMRVVHLIDAAEASVRTGSRQDR